MRERSWLLVIPLAVLVGCAGSSAEEQASRVLAGTYRGPVHESASTGGSSDGTAVVTVSADGSLDFVSAVNEADLVVERHVVGTIRSDLTISGDDTQGHPVTGTATWTDPQTLGIDVHWTVSEDPGLAYREVATLHRD